MMRESIFKKKIFSINKNLRVALIVINILILIGISYQLYTKYNEHSYKDIKRTVFSYSHIAAVDYRVFLIPNLIYSNNSLQSGGTYIRNFVDYVNTRFSYTFLGERASNISGKYRIYAQLEGLLGDEKGSKTIWKKSFLLQKDTPFKINSRSIYIKKDIPISLKAFNNFMDTANKASDLNLNSKFTVHWEVQINAKTDKGLISEKLSPFMEIPLNASSFEITGELTQKKDGKIEDTNKILVPLNQRIILIIWIFLVILLILLVVLVLFTGGKPLLSQYKKKVKNIFKLHGYRLVKLQHDINSLNSNVIRISSIEDLVKIADEEGRPILYMIENDIRYSFYIIQEDMLYLYEINQDDNEVENIQNRSITYSV